MACKGAMRGFFREFFGLLALACGFGAAAVWGPALGREALEPLAWFGATGSRVAACVLVFLVPYVGLRALGSVAHGLGQAIFLGGLDRLVGALFGGLAGVFLLGAGIDLAVESGLGAAWLAESRLAPSLREVFQRLAAWASGLGL
jgi:uncharacterized membrane protein required for colicin V production